uniref:Uncharacterized protein n=1 Tax=Romanomermis culicivorax TaxID=13658 RepID=A0A915JEQ6_ROMCU
MDVFPTPGGPPRGVFHLLYAQTNFPCLMFSVSTINTPWYGSAFNGASSVSVAAPFSVSGV